MHNIKTSHIVFAHLLFIFLNTITVEARVHAYIDKNMILHKLPSDNTTIHLSTKRAENINNLLKSNNNKISCENEYTESKPYLHSIDTIIESSALKHGVDPSLIRAVIKTESNFHKNSISRKGAQGLMQLMPETARDLNVSDPLDPKQNIAGGTKYLRSLLDNYNGKLELSLAAYNAGPGNVKDQIPNISETKQYVSKVMGNHKKYQGDHQANN